MINTFSKEDWQAKIRKYFPYLEKLHQQAFDEAPEDCFFQEQDRWLKRIDANSDIRDVPLAVVLAALSGEVVSSKDYPNETLQTLYGLAVSNGHMDFYPSLEPAYHGVPIRYACEVGNFSALQALATKVNFIENEYDFGLGLTLACAQNHRSIVEYILSLFSKDQIIKLKQNKLSSEHHEITFQDQFKAMGLMDAAANNHLTIIQLLLDKTSPYDHQRAFITAAKCGNLALVQFFLSQVRVSLAVEAALIAAREAKKFLVVCYFIQCFRAENNPSQEQEVKKILPQEGPLRTNGRQKNGYTHGINKLYLSEHLLKDILQQAAECNSVEIIRELGLCQLEKKVKFEPTFILDLIKAAVIRTQRQVANELFIAFRQCLSFEQQRALINLAVEKGEIIFTNLIIEKFSLEELFKVSLENMNLPIGTTVPPNDAEAKHSPRRNTEADNQGPLLKQFENLKLNGHSQATKNKLDQLKHAKESDKKRTLTF